MDSDDDFISCHICLYEYDYQEHQPKYLDCHHYFCSSCLKALCNTAVMNVFPCPTCRDPTKIRGRRIREFKTNHVVLRLIQLEQDRARERKFFSQILESLKSDSDDESSEEPSHKEAEAEPCPATRITPPPLPKPVDRERISLRRTNETLQQFRIRIARRRISNRRRLGEGSRDQREQVRRRW